ncbi:MAG: hypothetical protein ABSC77_12430 [Terracidiphilus sp.]|jgi:hypothetical protein
MKGNYRGFICAGILGCILVLLATPVFAQNNNPCKEANDQKCGIIKGCKVAGLGVAVGTPFAFTHTDPYGTGTATIPAGPAPGGYCKHGDPLPIGTNMVIQETPIPAGLSVSDIIVTPASQLVSINLITGTVTVKIGPGVTEVTYTDHSLKGGYLEICKQGIAGAAPMTGDFTFTVPGVPGPITVPVGYCSPPIEVPAGTLTIKETPKPGTHMVSCSAYPTGRQGPCNPAAWTSTVTVPSGVLSTQTIATITDAPGQGK